MNYKLLDLLVCPVCGGSLTLKVLKEVERDFLSSTLTEIIEGLLTCECGKIYPIVGSVPRMLPNALIEHREFARRHSISIQKIHKDNNGQRLVKTRRSFSLQWDMYEYSDLTWESTLEERYEYFLRYLQSTPETVRGKLVLDAGCGNGTLSAAICNFGVNVIGLDLSTSVERAEKLKAKFVDNNRLPFIHFVQGSVTQPPFIAESFDIVYSDGVLHHTPDTKKAFLSLVPLIKDSGKFFVWLYRADLKPVARKKLALIHALQRITKKLPLGVLFYLCFFGAILLQSLMRIQHVFGKSNGRIIPIKLKAVNLFDTFSPEFDRCHTIDEVAGWFAGVGFHDIIDVTIPELSKWGFGVLGTRSGLDGN